MARLGFTLAEVLITLGIIGVVASLTMPSLIENHREKITVTRLNHIYNLLSQAVEHMIQDEGDRTVLFWGENSAQRIDKFNELLPKYLKVVKTCNSYLENCFNWKYDNIANAHYSATTDFKYRYILNNGISLAITEAYKPSCIQTADLSYDPYNSNGQGYIPGTYADTCATLFIDVNGKKGPNKKGVDYFAFALVQDGIVPVGSANEKVWSQKFDETCLKDGSGCSAWVIYNKNMDYLHCPEKLGWDKVSSCKD